MRLSISASLGAGLTASNIRQNVRKRARGEGMKSNLYYHVCYFQLALFGCHTSAFLWFYLSISLYYVSLPTPSTDFKNSFLLSLSPPALSVLCETFPLWLAILTSVCESYRSHLFSAAVLLTCYWSLARPPLFPLDCSYTTQACETKEPQLDITWDLPFNCGPNPRIYELH